MNLKNYKHIHLIGIGGINVSAIAKLMLSQGKKVSGSDLAATDLTRELEDKGARVMIGHKRENVGQDVDLVIYTDAITNGKSTTTAMMGLIMEEAGLDPTLVVGTKVLQWAGNIRLGKSDWLVIEADEYRGHMLELKPRVAV